MGPQLAELSSSCPQDGALCPRMPTESMLHIFTQQLGSYVWKTPRVVPFHRWGICSQRGRCTFCSTHSIWDDQPEQGPGLQIPRPGSNTKAPALCLTADPPLGPQPDAPSGDSPDTGVWHLGWILLDMWLPKPWSGGPRLKQGLAPSGKPRGQGCLERGHRRLVRELKKRFCLLDLESSARRCCSSWGWGTDGGGVGQWGWAEPPPRVPSFQPSA